GQGRDAVKTLLLDNPDLMDELEGKIKEALKALGK
ncbi:MAG TPA: DNA recombination/repair protein RecA, partial [Flavobacteriaceae bacterium]|nr:DNA recombination/repair protein RecA [Flavobacteriaceae bacterium]HAB80639.1 DNA recombination/repair protein RecA [Flavobacteriaceae bacterium]